MHIVVLEELKAYIDPLTADEHEALERSLLAEGCRDALVLWNDILVDGHNRYGICQAHGIPFNTVQNTRFQSMEDVHLWMIEQHLGRRSVSDYQRGVLALRKRDIIAARQQAQRIAALQTAPATDAPLEDTEDRPPWDDAPSAVSRAELAREAKLSANQVAMIERIHASATPELVEALKTGAISMSAAAAVASLPEDEQRSAAQAGKAELRQAAKRARDAKKRPKAGGDGEDAGEDAAPKPDLKALQRRVSQLEAENEDLRGQIEILQNQIVRLRG
ncbi:plasmid replication/partition related protein [Luteimonas terrae]|uniref:Plasmid replication/partition related protein n=1 Tax=Luteimonas terrae TaxID=1530191 RepID=A0A4R5UCQ6_9GAMM|nr:plasmid replication/partition related protein [Luteimonas terrae]TDK33065.1 plasmid replication/partition related protein [Luteimonas terrae]